MAWAAASGFAVCKARRRPRTKKTFFFPADLFPNCCQPSALACRLPVLPHSPLRGSHLGPAGGARSSTLSSGGSASLFGCGGAGHAQPRAVLATACWTATASIPHQRLDHPAPAAVLTAGGARCARTRTSPAQSAPPRHSSARRLQIPVRGGVGVQLGAIQDRWRACGVRPCGAPTRPSPRRRAGAVLCG